MTLNDYEDVLAFADLRGGNEYVTSLPGGGERQVCAIALARLGPTRGGEADATLLIELDETGKVLGESLYLAPREAMESWSMVAWEPLAGVGDVDQAVRARMAQ